mmetsp:Transcript_43536/g.100231  ORF Transcript_43536/g.100231 Transcript_43536/m.100231 type:complete len:80 (+) Transcript_43536:533-772(+)
MFTALFHLLLVFILECTDGKTGCPAKQNVMIPMLLGKFHGSRYACSPCGISQWSTPIEKAATTRAARANTMESADSMDK